MSYPLLIDGRLQANRIFSQVKEAIDLRRDQNLPLPGLAVLRVGDNPASLIYVNRKKIACQKVGVHFKEFSFPETTSQETLKTLIEELNQDSSIHGILIQLPLPSHLSPRDLLQTINPYKDVDGLHDLNMGRLWNGYPLFIPCTPKGCLSLLKTYTPSLAGKRAVVLGRSQIVGRPMSHLLLQAHCTVTVVHSYTTEAPDICREADVIVSAMGRPHLIKSFWIKPGAVVLDVGISRLVDSQGTTVLLGDVDFKDVAPLTSAISPVPGGVGPMTIASLLENCLQAAQIHDTLKDQTSFS